MKEHNIELQIKSAFTNYLKFQDYPGYESIELFTGFPEGVQQHIGQNIGHFFKKYRIIQDNIDKNRTFSAQKEEHFEI